MSYKLHLPENYKKVGFPGLNDWLTALRSGNYSQGKFRLRCPESDRYCCLGVLSKIQGRLKADNSDGGASIFSLGDHNPVQYIATHLPEGVYVEVEGSKALLELTADLNDEGLSFNEIADILEQTYDSI